jgi:hypothetical protein
LLHQQQLAFELLLGAQQAELSSFTDFSLNTSASSIFW